VQQTLAGFVNVPGEKAPRFVQPGHYENTKGILEDAAAGKDADVEEVLEGNNKKPLDAVMQALQQIVGPQQLPADVKVEDEEAEDEEAAQEEAPADEEAPQEEAPADEKAAQEEAPQEGAAKKRTFFPSVQREMKTAAAVCAARKQYKEEVEKCSECQRARERARKTDDLEQWYCDAHQKKIHDLAKTFLAFAEQ
jgi:hypothetical protein